jgi:hypothetical protein
VTAIICESEIKIKTKAHVNGEEEYEIRTSETQIMMQGTNSLNIVNIIFSVRSSSSCETSFIVSDSEESREKHKHDIN